MHSLATGIPAFVHCTTLIALLMPKSLTQRNKI